jgi:hypothetical protein
MHGFRNKFYKENSVAHVLQYAPHNVEIMWPIWQLVRHRMFSVAHMTFGAPQNFDT